jgi:abortive infection bacteriophage resistance protein
VKFEEILQLYYFDKEFRNLIFYSIEKIEVYLRTQLAHAISQRAGAFGYSDVLMFHDQVKHQEIMNTIKSETSRSKEIFVNEYFKKYDERRLPIWAMVEIISFNTLSKIFANLKEKYRKEILKELDVKPLVFENWLHTLTYVRNICAHHSRLWNKTLAIEPKKPKNQKVFELLNSKKIFYVISMILFMLEKIDDEELNFKNEIKKLTLKYPNVNLFSMGFIKEWESLELCR